MHHWTHGLQDMLLDHSFYKFPIFVSDLFKVFQTDDHFTQGSSYHTPQLFSIESLLNMTTFSLQKSHPLKWLLVTSCALLFSRVRRSRSFQIVNANCDCISGKCLKFLSSISGSCWGRMLPVSIARSQLSLEEQTCQKIRSNQLVE